MSVGKKKKAEGHPPASKCALGQILDGDVVGGRFELKRWCRRCGSDLNVAGGCAWPGCPPPVDPPDPGKRFTIDEVRRLFRGEVVVSLRHLDRAGADVSIGTLGVVFEEAEFYEPDSGPMVRWLDGRMGACNVYDGDVGVVSAVVRREG